jgi:isocitrate dehydrogenase
MTQFENYNLPTEGQKITIKDGVIQVPNNPIIPFIEGDGTGVDIWITSKRVLDAAIEKAYEGEKKIAWYEVYAGEKAFNKYNNWLPKDTLTALREYCCH